jgi:hypothetical protein
MKEKKNSPIVFYGRFCLLLNVIAAISDQFYSSVMHTDMDALTTRIYGGAWMSHKTDANGLMLRTLKSSTYFVSSK